MAISALRVPEDASTLGAMLRWHVGDVVRKMREERHWNQSQLAKRAKLNKATIVRVEEGGNSKRETLEAVAGALGVTVGALYGEIPNAEAGVVKEERVSRAFRTRIKRNPSV